MKRAGPGVAGANRARSGPFSRLLDQILNDEDALDALVFAYGELRSTEERCDLARAVLEDATDPVPALSALLAVEPNPGLRRRLAGWIGRRRGVQREAHLEGDEIEGRACLVQRLPGLALETLRLVWKQHDIESIEIESGTDISFCERGAATGLDEAAERLTPLLWRHIRSGAALPAGIDRFAPFFAPMRPARG